MYENVPALQLRAIYFSTLADDSCASAGSAG